MSLTRSCWSLAALLIAIEACSNADPKDLTGNREVLPREEGDDSVNDAENADDADGPLSPEGASEVPSAPPSKGESCALREVAKAPYLKSGLHPRASDALAALGVDAAHVTQTIGSAVASAGTHEKDGTFEGHDYSAAVDLSVRDMSEEEVARFVDRLTEVGFIAYYRRPGFDGWPASEARHVHAIWVAAPMKLLLRKQVRDWRVGKNALASHTVYTFKTWSTCWREAIAAEYLKANPAGA